VKEIQRTPKKKKKKKKRRDPCSQIGRINTVKISILPKAICNFYTISIKRAMTLSKNIFKSHKIHMKL
jgi:hypothetical protein